MRSALRTRREILRRQYKRKREQFSCEESISTEVITYLQSQESQEPCIHLCFTKKRKTDVCKRDDAFVSFLHSPRGETETRRSVWPDQSQRQLVPCKSQGTQMLPPEK